MRTKVEDLNKKINNVDLGDITIVKSVFMDTTDNDEAVAYAEEYAKNNGLKLCDIHIGLSNWYTKKTGRVAMFYKA